MRSAGQPHDHPPAPPGHARWCQLGEHPPGVPCSEIVPDPRYAALAPADLIGDRAGAVAAYESDLARHRDRAADMIAVAFRRLAPVTGPDPGRYLLENLRSCAAALSEAIAEQAAYEALRDHAGLAHLAATPAPPVPASWPSGGQS